MKTFFTRTSTAVVFVAIMLGGLLSNYPLFPFLMTLILLGSLSEYFKITAPKRERNEFNSSFIALLFFAYFLSYYFAFTGKDTVGLNVIVPAAALCIFVPALFSRSDNPFADVGWNIIPVFWILVPLILASKIYLQRGGLFLLAIFGLIWIFDSGSYIFGSLIGRHKLFERVSPKKTWEGLIGGVVITLVVAFFAEKIPTLAQLTKIWWLILAGVIVIASTFGDLIESLLKRSLGIKDSGRIMPGHGGFLDRFDAFYFSVPFVALALWLMEFMGS
jgi:phosphatidate cytidylyltransferase